MYTHTAITVMALTALKDASRALQQKKSSHHWLAAAKGRQMRCSSNANSSCSRTRSQHPDTITQSRNNQPWLQRVQLGKHTQLQAQLQPTPSLLISDHLSLHDSTKQITAPSRPVYGALLLTCHSVHAQATRIPPFQDNKQICTYLCSPASRTKSLLEELI
jgi:hypothetical protein